MLVVPTYFAGKTTRAGLTSTTGGPRSPGPEPRQTQAAAATTARYERLRCIVVEVRPAAGTHIPPVNAKLHLAGASMLLFPPVGGSASSGYGRLGHGMISELGAERAPRHRARSPADPRKRNR